MQQHQQQSGGLDNDDEAQNHSTALRTQSRSAAAVPAHQSSVWTSDASQQQQQQQQQQPDARPQPVAYADRLAHFYRKYNKVLLDSIDKEKERLVSENAQIEDLIQQYISGTKITGDTLLGDNPLFVVNGR